MRGRTFSHRLIACLLLVAFGALAVGPEPAYASAGDWARSAIHTIAQKAKATFNKVKRWFSYDDATLGALKERDAQKEIEKMSREGEKLRKLEEMMTEQERRANNLKKIAEAEERHIDAVKNMKEDAERLGLTAEDEQKRDALEVSRWGGIMKALQADREAMQDLIRRAGAEPVPPACPFLKGQIENSKRRMEEAFHEYLGGYELAYMNAVMAHTGFQEAMGVWGTMILASVAFIANVVTTITLIAEFVAFVKGTIVLVKVIFQGGWKALRWAGVKFQQFFAKMYRFATDRRAIVEFVNRTREMITKLFDSILEKLGAILKRAVDKISRAWEQLKAGEFKKAWDELTTLKDDVSEAQGLHAASEQAAAQGEQAAASAKERAKEALRQYDEATKDKIDYVNNAHTVEESIEKGKAELYKAENKAAGYAIQVVKAVDAITFQWNELSEAFKDAYRFRESAKEAEKKYAEGKEVMERAKRRIYREIEFFSSLLKKECLNTAP